MNRGAAALLVAAYVIFLGLTLAFGLLWRTEELLEAWLLAVLVLAGLATGSLALLMIGHLFSEAWLRPIRLPLEAAASTLPLVAALLIPVASGADLVFPWAAGPVSGIPHLRQLYFDKPFVLFRGVVIVITWIGVAMMVLWRGRDPRVSAPGLALVAFTTALSVIDWVSSREPTWWSSLFAFAYAVTQLTGAMALALLLALLQPGWHPDRRRYHSLQQAAITLALLTFWVWFAQFLVIWMANLPSEAAWYISRAQGGWLWLKLFVIIPSLLIALALLLPTEPGRTRFVLAAAFLLLNYLAHMIWIVRPASSTISHLTWMDLLVWLALGALWGTWIAGIRTAWLSASLPSAERRSG